MNIQSPALIRETFPVGPLQCNCTIIGDPVTKKAIVVDPGGNHELILARLDALGLKVVSIIHTHAHLDHFLPEIRTEGKKVESRSVSRVLS
jgi:hydroxyacylglutathione hydrolase